MERRESTRHLLRHGAVVHARIVTRRGASTDHFTIASVCGGVTMATTVPAVGPGRSTNLHFEDTGPNSMSATIENPPAHMVIDLAVAFKIGARCEDPDGAQIVVFETLKPTEAASTNGGGGARTPCVEAWKPPHFAWPSAADKAAGGKPLITGADPQLQDAVFGNTVKLTVPQSRVDDVGRRVQLGAYSLPVARPTGVLAKPDENGDVALHAAWPDKPAYTARILCDHGTPASLLQAAAVAQSSLDASAMLPIVAREKDMKELLSWYCAAEPNGLPVSWATIDAKRPERVVSAPGEFSIVHVACNDAKHLPAGGRGVLRLDRGRLNTLRVMLQGYGAPPLPGAARVTLAPATDHRRQVGGAPLPSPLNDTDRAMIVNGSGIARALSSTRQGLQRWVFDAVLAVSPTAAAAVDEAIVASAVMTGTIHRAMVRLPVSVVDPDVRIVAQAHPSGSYRATVLVHADRGVLLNNLHLSVSHSIEGVDAVEWGDLSTDLCRADDEWRVVHCELTGDEHADAASIAAAASSSELKSPSVAVQLSLSVPPYFTRPARLKIIVTADNLQSARGSTLRHYIDIGPGVSAEPSAPEPAMLVAVAGSDALWPYRRGAMTSGSDVYASTDSSTPSDDAEGGSAEAQPKRRRRYETVAVEEFGGDPPLHDESAFDQHGGGGGPSSTAGVVKEDRFSPTSGDATETSTAAAAAPRDGLVGALWLVAAEAEKTRQSILGAYQFVAVLLFLQVSSSLLAWRKELRRRAVARRREALREARGREHNRKAAVTGSRDRVSGGSPAPVPSNVSSPSPHLRDVSDGSHPPHLVFCAHHSWLGVLLPCTSECRPAHISLLVVKLLVTLVVCTLLHSHGYDRSSWYVYIIVPLVTAFCFRRSGDAYFHGTGPLMRALAIAGGWSCVLTVLVYTLYEAQWGAVSAAPAAPSRDEPHGTRLWLGVYPALELIAWLDALFLETLFAAAATLSSLTRR